MKHQNCVCGAFSKMERKCHLVDHICHLLRSPTQILIRYMDHNIMLPPVNIVPSIAKPAYPTQGSFSRSYSSSLDRYFIYLSA